MAVYTKKVKFVPAVLLKHRDTLGVTKFEPFRPTYCENEHNMFDLMSFHYQRLWAQDKDDYFKKYDVTKEQAESALLRRHAPKHQHNVPRLAFRCKQPVKFTAKYQHIKSKYMDYKPPRGINHCRMFVVREK